MQISIYTSKSQLENDEVSGKNRTGSRSKNYIDEEGLYVNINYGNKPMKDSMEIEKGVITKEELNEFFDFDIDDQQLMEKLKIIYNKCII